MTLDLPCAGALVLAALVFGIIIGLALGRPGREVPPDGPHRYELTSMDQRHTVILTFPDIPTSDLWVLCNRAIRGQDLDFRSVMAATSLSRAQYQQVRDELKRRFPDAFDKQGVLRPTPPVMEFFRKERENLRTTQHNTATQAPVGGFRRM
jgi:hypothetical protein